MTNPNARLRIDKWLWAARFFKTRGLAASAVNGGKVRVNGERTKSAKRITTGDELTITRGPYEYRVRVLGLSARRGPADEAAELYAEDPASLDKRRLLAAQLKLERAAGQRPAGRPDKRQRRHIIRFTRASGPQ